MIVKMCGLGLKNYFYDSNNTFDFFVILFSLLDLLTLVTYQIIQYETD